MRFERAEETDKVSLISVSFYPPYKLDILQPVSIKPPFYPAKNSFNAFGTLTYPDGNVDYLRLANKVHGLVCSKTVNTTSLMIKERFKKRLEKD